MTSEAVPAQPAIDFPRDLGAFDYLMFRAEADPRSRSAGLTVALLDEAPDLARLRGVFDRASRVVVRLRQHVVVPALPIGSPRWVIDPDFDLEFHVRHVRLPEPGTLRQLLDLAQPILSAPFDVARPLWEAYLVEGLSEPGCSAAMLMKMHHSLTDGVGALELLRQLYDFERDADRGPMPLIPPPEDLSSVDLVKHAGRRAPQSMVTSSVVQARRAVRVARRVAGDPSRAVRDLGSFVSSARRVISPPPVAPSPVLARRSLGRRFETIEFPLDQFRRAARSAGGSVNDAFISAVGAVLRLYHEGMGVMVDAVPLAMPVSLRRDDDPMGGNRWAGARLPVPVSEPDPAKRITEIRELVLGAVGEPAIDALNWVAPMLIHLPGPLLGALSSITAGTDVQASNIPGYPVTTYVAGAKVLKVLPFGPLPGVAMMIVLYTQAGVGYVGVHYDTASVKDQELFARCLREGFDEVLALDPERRPARRRKAQP